LRLKGAAKCIQFSTKPTNNFSRVFLTFPFGNKLHLNMPVLEESHLGYFGASLLCTSGLCGKFLLMF